MSELVGARWKMGGGSIFYFVMRAKDGKMTNTSNFKSDKSFSVYFLMNLHLLFLAFSYFIYRPKKTKVC